MSKSKGNLVAPEAIVDEYGADTLRLAHLAVKPPDEDVDWEDFGLEGCSRFLHRVWRLAVPGSDLGTGGRGDDEQPDDVAIRRATHRLIADITTDFERWSFNTAVAKFMSFVNELYRYVGSVDGPHLDVIESSVDVLLELLAPACPHVAAELWERRHPNEHIHLRSWPVADPALLRRDSVIVPVQVAGKVRARVSVAVDADDAAYEAVARADAKVADLLAAASVRRVVVVPGRLVSFVLD
jgi:leucyl-tRNA synthetase